MRLLKIIGDRIRTSIPFPLAKTSYSGSKIDERNTTNGYIPVRHSNVKYQDLQAYPENREKTKSKPGKPIGNPISKMVCVTIWMGTQILIINTSKIWACRQDSHIVRTVKHCRPIRGIWWRKLSQLGTITYPNDERQHAFMSVIINRIHFIIVGLGFNPPPALFAVHVNPLASNYGNATPTISAIPWLPIA